LSVLGGGIRLASVSRKTIERAACARRRLFSGVRGGTLAATCVLLIGAAGCGGGGGVSSDAVVTAYVEAPLCAAAKQELARHSGRAGDLRVQAICLPGPHEAKKLSLATLGANARRATEDSTAVAYLEAPDPEASRFVHPILETAEVPWISAKSGSVAMSRLLTLIPEADSGSLRESLREELNET
jgi:hypothetical protein